MRDYLRRLRATTGLREPGLVAATVLALSSVAVFRVALLPEFGGDLAMSTFQLGMVTTVFAVGRLAADLPGGHLADRVGARRLMASSAGGVAVGSLILGLSPAAAAVYVAAFLLGMASATTNATGMTFFASVTGAGDRGTSMAIFSAALLGGQALGPAAAGLISSVGGWRFAMFAGAAAAGVVSVLLLTLRSESTNRMERAATGPPRPGRAESPSLVPMLVLHSVSFAMFLTLGSVPQTLVPIIGADELGLGTAAIGLALGVGGLARFVGSLVGGRLSDRLPRKVVLVPGLLLQGFGVGLLALDPGVAVWLAAIVVMSLASFAIQVAATILGDITHPARVGTQLGRFRFVGDLGLVAGPLVVTAMFERLGRVAAFSLVTGLLTLAALLSWRLLPETRGGPG